MKGDIIMSKFELATILHDSLCPMCNGRCFVGEFCSFTHNPSEKDWETNSANHYFLQLAEKANKIMEEVNISVDEFIAYAQSFPNNIPENVMKSMERNNFHP